MKRNVVSLGIILLLVTGSVTAQKWRLNLSGGLEKAVFAVSGVESGPLVYKSGLGAGLEVEMNCSSVVSIQPGVHFSQQGSAIVNADGDAGGSYTFNYITIPLLIRLKATSHLHLFAGPQVGFLLSAKQKTFAAVEADVKDLFKSNDFYAVLGAEYRFAKGVFIGARYHYGISNVLKDDTGGTQDIKNRYYSFRFGYSFPLGK